MKKWFASLFDHTIPLQERTFRLVAAFGLTALSVMGLLSFVMQESAIDIFLIFLGLVAFAVIVGLSIKLHRVNTGVTLISFILIFILLPSIFVASGGMYGGTPMWFLFAAVFVSLVVRGRRRIFFLISDGIVLTACYIVQWYFPERVTAHTDKMAYTDSLASTIIVGTFISLMVIFVVKVYIEEQRIADRQRKEIEEINLAQNRFFSNMSHEIRTPVNTIIGLNEMIMREAVEEEVREDARSIQGASQMLLALINDILDMSKIQSGKMELVPGEYSVGDLLSEIVNMIWSRAKEKGLEFHVEVDESTPRMLIGDEVRIKQILINLLNNAVKYTNEGSVTLTVECRRVPENNSAMLICSVTDTGIGIRKEALPMLFDVFRRVDEQKNKAVEGTGLGLSIVKQLVELMNGEITVDSVYTKGSTFRVRIPQEIADGEALGRLTLKSGHRLHEMDEYKQSFEAPDASVLVVDDNDMNLSVVEKLLSSTKVQTDTALSGVLALELTQNRHYDVILMDHLMPDMDGIETLAAIRAQKGGMNRETPVIALTANAGSDNIALYRRSGFDGYLLKPVTGSQLEEAVLSKLPRQLVSMTGISTLRADKTEIMDMHRQKTAIAVTVESGCDLPRQLIASMHIDSIPCHIVTDEGVFDDGVDIDTGETLAYMGKNPGKRITSTVPTVEEYEAFFAEKLLTAEHVFHVTTSYGGELGFANASEAANSFGNVTIFDSGQVSGGIGMLAILASRMADAENLTPAALYQTMFGIKHIVRTKIIADSTLRLQASGRINQRMAGILMSFLVKPILVPSHSGYGLRGIVTGPRQQYMAQFVKKALKGMDIDTGRLFVMSPNLPPEEAKHLEENIRKQTGFEDIRFLRTGAATTLVWGPDTVAFVYLLRQRERSAG